MGGDREAGEGFSAGWWEGLAHPLNREPEVFGLLVGAEDIPDGIDQNVTETAYVLLALEEKSLNLRGQLIGPVFQFCPVGICYGVTAG